MDRRVLLILRFDNCLRGAAFTAEFGCPTATLSFLRVNAVEDFPRTFAKNLVLRYDIQQILHELIIINDLALLIQDQDDTGDRVRYIVQETVIRKKVVIRGYALLINSLSGSKLSRLNFHCFSPFLLFGLGYFLIVVYDPVRLFQHGQFRVVIPRWGMVIPNDVFHDLYFVRGEINGIKHFLGDWRTISLLSHAVVVPVFLLRHLDAHVMQKGGSDNDIRVTPGMIPHYALGMAENAQGMLDTPVVRTEVPR